MSSSLFYDCYADYEVYPTTEYVKGEKKFSEVSEGDFLYSLDYDTCKITKLCVEKPFTNSRGRCRIKVKGRTIDFGPSNCVNVLEGADKSIIYIEDEIIGTSKEVVVNKKVELLKHKISEIKSEMENLSKQLEKVLSL